MKDIILTKEESFHCVKVLRCKTGDHVQVTDGRGGLYVAKIVSPEVASCKLEIIEKIDIHPILDYQLHFGIAPTKSIDRFEWFIEKATEIGVSSITPLLCDHSERKNLRMDRLEKVAIAALKQSKNNFLPQIMEMTDYSNFVESFLEGEKYIAHCDDVERYDIRELKKHAVNTFLIGPEGDFSMTEIKLAKQYGFKQISLGRSRLRTETAGIFVCSAFRLLK